MAPTIPPEIWMRTAEFLPSSILGDLYSVNSVFLHLALDVRYTHVRLCVVWTPRTAKYVRHLNDPHIAPRVRRLSLSSNWLQSNMPPGLRATLVSYLPFSLGQFIDPVVSNIQICNTLMQNTVLNLPNLTSLAIVEGFTSPSFQTRLSPLLLNTYATCASNLRSLALVAHSPNFQLLFPANGSDLTSLEEVSLFFCPLDDCTGDTETASAFFQAITSTLTTLNLFLRNASGEPLRLLQGLGSGNKPFPKLASFHLESPAPPRPNLLHFLNQHADTLKHLHLRHTKKSQLLRLPVLPHLESLDVEGPPHFHESATPEGLDDLCTKVQHSRSALTSLGLTHSSFSLRDLTTLLDLFVRRSAESAEGGLKSLTVSVQVLSPQLLDILAEKLPQLGRLKVYFDCLRSTDALTDGNKSDVTEEVIKSFLTEMEKRYYSEWALRSLGIDGWDVRADMAATILMPLTLHIPRLVDVDCGNGLVELWRMPGSTWNASERSKVLYHLDSFRSVLGTAGVLFS